MPAQSRLVAHTVVLSAKIFPDPMRPELMRIARGAAHKTRDASMLLEAYACSCVAAHTQLAREDAEQRCSWACWRTSPLGMFRTMMCRKGRDACAGIGRASTLLLAGSLCL